MDSRRRALSFARLSGLSDEGAEYCASTLGNKIQPESVLRGGVQEMSAPATTSLVGIVKEFGLVVFPFLGVRNVTNSKRPVAKIIASYDPAIAKLYTDELTRIHQG